jgi:Flp pilus assembly protein TadD
MAGDAEQPGGMEPKAKIFISYSRKDMAFVDRLEPALKAHGFEPLIDRDEIYAFEKWWERLQALIGQADTVVFVLSPDAVASREALREVEYATSLNKRFAPIVCRRVEDSAVPEALRQLNFIFFDDPERFDASLERLTDALRTDIGWIRQHTVYGEAAQQWSAAGRPGGLLLRSPALEEAERWIASRPANAPAPTEETQVFIVESRSGATRRRNILTGSLAAGLLIALVLAGLAYWQRGIAVQERQIADEQRQRAEDTLAAATKTANSLVFDMAQRFRDTIGIPATVVKDILDRARDLQEQLTKSNQVTPDLKYSKASALSEMAGSLQEIGDTAGALSAAEQARQILAALVAASPNNNDWQRDLAVTYDRVGDVRIAQNHLADALASYRSSFAIRQNLAKSDPDNAAWQRAIAISEENLGSVAQAQNDLKAALTSYQDSLVIRRRLAEANPGNIQRQTNLALAYDEVGRVQLAQGNLADALASFRAALAVRESEARSAPDNGEVQLDLSVSHERIGDAQSARRTRHLPRQPDNPATARQIRPE